ncbi:MAG: TonB-dependent receptor plug domain-containing protein [Mesonia hippocampi]|uniref:TonB-dependent receptor plug domain-containing protein n=1 Tax=Mesonia hippocampi TaxID=1628250 RepID=UPI003F9727C4
MSKQFLLILCLWISIGSSLVFAQQKTISLYEALKEIQLRFPYKFSYANQTINNINIPYVPKNIDFEQTLEFLEKESGLKFSLLEKSIVTVYKKPESNVVFREVQLLEEIIISNYITKGITKRLDGSYKIDYKNFGILPGLVEPDPLKTIQALPGVESVNETVSNLNIRGGTHDQNLILWDGIKLYQSGHFFGLISAINPYLTKTTTLYKNGTPSKFGNSVSGVISLETDNYVNPKFKGEAGVNFISIDALADILVAKKTSVQVAARTSINGTFVTPTYNKYYARAFQDTEITSNTSNQINTHHQFSFSDISLRALSQLSNEDKLRINFVYFSNELNFKENKFINQQLKTNQSNLNQENLGVGIFYQKQWNSRVQTNVQTYFSNYQLAAINTEIDLNSQKERNTLQDYSMLAETNWQINSYIKWNNGYELNLTKVDNTNSFNVNNKNKLATHAIFSTLEYTSNNKKTKINLGSRFNYFGKINHFRAEPRLSLNQKLSKAFSVEVSGELKSQTTTQISDFQTNFLGIENRKWELTTAKNLPILKSKQLSLGINFSKKNWLASAEIYSKEVKNLPSQSQEFQNQYEYTSVLGKYNIKGIDFLVSKSLKNFNIWATYSINNNKYTFPEFSPKHFPNNFEIKNSITLGSSFHLNKFKASLGILWRNGKPFTPLTTYGETQDVFDYDTANSRNLKDYKRIDFSVSQEFSLGNKITAHAGLSIWNIFDFDNIINAYYKQQNDEILLIKQKALGTTPNFIFRLKF